ncbi:hypothetical protein GCM10010199_48700 [Dactylosporangium roseum]
MADRISAGPLRRSQGDAAAVVMTKTLVPGGGRRNERFSAVDNARFYPQPGVNA